MAAGRERGAVFFRDVAHERFTVKFALAGLLVTATASGSPSLLLKFSQ